MTPEPDEIVIGIYADGSMLPFILSTTHMALALLSNDLFEFDLKAAVLARGLLAPATLQNLFEAGEALRESTGPAADTAEPAMDEADEADDANTEGRTAWNLTLADAVAIGTANDFIASAYLTGFGEEMRAVQVEHNGVPAEAYDAQLHETLNYLARFQAEWGELFGGYASYQVRMDELAALRAEFVG